eukprot:6825310-Prymnesium_polylepis.1
MLSALAALTERHIICRALASCLREHRGAPCRENENENKRCLSSSIGSSTSFSAGAKDDTIDALAAATRSALRADYRRSEARADPASPHMGGGESIFCFTLAEQELV